MLKPSVILESCIHKGKIFTELRRGDTDRREFFDRIMEVVAMMGGEGSDAL